MMLIVIKKIFGWAIIFLTLIFTTLVSVGVVYTLEALYGPGKQIYQMIEKGSFDGFGFGEAGIIVWALLAVFLLLSVLQFVKSLFDQSVKKACDIFAEKLVNKLVKWTEK